MLYFFRACGNWDTLASPFKISTATIHRVIYKFVQIFHEWSYHSLDKLYEQGLTVTYLPSKNLIFENFPNACYATDNTFEMSPRPAGIIEKIKNISAASIIYMDWQLKFLSCQMELL